MFQFNELRAEQRRQLVDARQVFSAWQLADGTFRRRFAGSMRWLNRKGRDYLHRKVGNRERSLGLRSPETEAQHDSFRAGRDTARTELKRLTARLDEMAPVNRALGLGRIPRLPARILRRLNTADLLGSHILLVGTNALFSYESRAGVLLEAGLLATGDADRLWDARQRMALLLPDVRRQGILGLLQKTDRSFKTRSPRDYRAYNADGYWVDLIRPEDRNFFRTSRTTVGENDADLHGAPIGGLRWLVNVPRFEEIAIAEDGYPVRLVSPDPRAFALHKLWLSAKDDRDPAKRPRDVQQADMVAQLCTRYLGLSFDAEDLRALPETVRGLGAKFLHLDHARPGSLEPDWM
ncbi:MAG: hypothetical protein ACI9OJ_002449 [Myxococcota bacterium]|jgi:hypothetical protein